MRVSAGILALLVGGCAADEGGGGSTSSGSTSSSSGDLPSSASEEGSTTGAGSGQSGDSTGIEGSTGNSESTGAGEESTGSTGAGDELRCTAGADFSVAWWTGIGGEGEFAGGIAVAASPAGELYIEERSEADQQIIRQLGALGEANESWDLGTSMSIGSQMHHGIFFGPTRQAIGIGLHADGLWTASLDLAEQETPWSDVIADYAGWADVPVDAAFAADGSIYITSQIEQGVPLVREIVLAKYSAQGEREWNVIVPNNVIGGINHMSRGVVVKPGGEIVVVNRSAVVFHRYDADGGFLGDVNDVLYGINGTPRFVDIDRQGRLVLGVAEPVSGGNVAQVRRYDEDLAAEWEVQFEGVGFANELMMGLDADDRVVVVHTFADVPAIHRVEDGDVVFTQDLNPIQRTTSMTMVGDCSFVLTGQQQDNAEDWQYWRRLYEPAP